MMNQGRLANLPSGYSSRLERSPRGGPAGGWTWFRTAGSWRVPADQRGMWMASAAVQETGVWGTLHIPQRQYICTDRCSHANLKRRGAFPQTNLQVRRRNTHTHTSCLHSANPVNDFSPSIYWTPWGLPLVISVFTLSIFLWLYIPWALIIASADDVSNQQTFIFNFLHCLHKPNTFYTVLNKTLKGFLLGA